MNLVPNRCSGVLFIAKIIFVLSYEAYLIINRTDKMLYFDCIVGQLHSCSCQYCLKDRQGDP